MDQFPNNEDMQNLALILIGCMLIAFGIATLVGP